MIVYFIYKMINFLKKYRKGEENGTEIDFIMYANSMVLSNLFLISFQKLLTLPIKKLRKISLVTENFHSQNSLFLFFLLQQVERAKG